MVDINEIDTAIKILNDYNKHKIVDDYNVKNFSEN